MGEAVDVAVTLGWWLVGWIVVLGAVLTVVLLAVGAVGAWAVRGAWRWLRNRPRPSTAKLPFPALIASRRRPNPLPAVPSDVRAPERQS